MSTRILEGFSVSHAAILDGVSPAFAGDNDDPQSLTLATDLYGVKEASLEADISDFDNEGDDSVLSTWYWLNYANVSVTMGYVPLDAISAITGETVRSTADAVAPVLTSITRNGSSTSELILTFSEELAAVATGAAQTALLAGITFAGGAGKSGSPTIVIAGKVVTLAGLTGVTDSATVQYAKPAEASRLKDAAGNEVANFGPLSVGYRASARSTDEDVHEINIWTESALNQPTRPLLLQLPAKDSDGVPRRLYIVLYRVQFAPLSFQGPSYKEGLMVDYSGKALISTKDETGTDLPSGVRAIGKLVSVRG